MDSALNSCRFLAPPAPARLRSIADSEAYAASEQQWLCPCSRAAHDVAAANFPQCLAATSGVTPGLTSPDAVPAHRLRARDPSSGRHILCVKHYFRPNITRAINNAFILTITT
jgi:hypothetical protein